jgi:desulfoferrodoxin (superoxide reductase-like protein)
MAKKKKHPVKHQIKRKKKSAPVEKKHIDRNSHNVKINIGAVPQFQDPHAVREIQLFADNDYQLYRSRKVPILKNLTKKFKKGTFDLDRSAKLWEYYVTDALQRYAKEHGGTWHKILSMGDRKLLAKEYADSTLAEFKLGNFWEK